MNVSLHPSLQAAVDAGGLDPAQLDVAHPIGDGGAPRPRESILLVSGDKFADWHVPSLRALCRGSRTPPDMRDYPPAYVPVFFELERHLLTLAGLDRVPTDAELEEAFANLRRRPDGRSLGLAHDVLWRASALALGKFALSEAEFGAVVGRLSRSAGTWKRGPTSREYIAYVRQTFG